MKAGVVSNTATKTKMRFMQFPSNFTRVNIPSSCGKVTQKIPRHVPTLQITPPRTKRLFHAVGSETTGVAP